MKERWLHTCVLILLRVWDEGSESGSCTIPQRAICGSIGSTSGATCTGSISVEGGGRSVEGHGTSWQYISRGSRQIGRGSRYMGRGSLLMYSRCFHIRHVVE